MNVEHMIQHALMKNSRYTVLMIYIYIYGAVLILNVWWAPDGAYLMFIFLLHSLSLSHQLIAMFCPPSHRQCTPLALL